MRVSAVPTSDRREDAQTDAALPPSPDRTGRRLALIAAAIVVFVVVVIALAGGFADVPDARQPTYGLGDTYDNGLYRIEFEALEVTDRDPASGTVREGSMVVLRARLTYTGDEPARRAFGWLSPLDLRLDQGSGSTVSVRDGSVDPPVQPGLPVDVYYVWNLADDETPPDAAEVRIGIYERYLDPTNPIEDATTGRVLAGIVQERP